MSTITYPSIGATGTRLDLKVREGADFGPYNVNIINPDGTPMDLTAVIADAQLRTSYEQPDPPSATFTISIDALNGVIAISLPATVTATLKSSYYWDLKVTWSNGDISVLLYGEAQILERVTR